MFAYFMRWTRRPSPKGLKQWACAYAIAIFVIAILVFIGHGGF